MPLTGEINAIHCVGIGGSGVSALAELFLARGLQVSGSDVQSSPVTERLRQKGATIRIGHGEAHVPEKCDLVVYSPAVDPTNPELLTARRRNIPVLSLPEAIGHLMQGRVGVAVAGTHGKSTTAALLGYILTEAGLDPTVIVGAVVRNWCTSSRSGQGPVVVAEACEYARSFLALRPRRAVLLNIDDDHLDYYANVEALRQAYRSFVLQLPADGYLLVRDDPSLDRVVANVACPIETFGESPKADWRFEVTGEDRGRCRYRLYYKGRFVSESRSSLLGKHNVANCIAAIAMASRLGVPAVRAVEIAESFAACARRLEFVGWHNGVAYFDDYAHHPTAVRLSLSTLRSACGPVPLWCVFQPHQLWRAVQLSAQFAEALSIADGVIVLPVYAARERAQRETCERAARRLAALCRKSGQRVYFAPTLETAALILRQGVPRRRVVTMGAGDVWKVRDVVSTGTRAHCKAG